MPDFPGFSFDISKRDSATRARRGRLTTPHGAIETPAFVFCATRGAIRGAAPREVAEAGTQVVLSNTYHLMLQPGAARLAALGGLHRFMGWDGPLFTDSGGFQIFSLGAGWSETGGIGPAKDGAKGGSGAAAAPGRAMVRITEDGAAFRSHIDGTHHLLTPERSIEVQRDIGADCILVLDECPPPGADRDVAAVAMARSQRWATRSLAEFERGANGAQALYGIVQGGQFDDLRRESADFANAQPFFGHAVGGVFGGDHEDLAGVLDMTMPHLAPERPVHLLGIGVIGDVWDGVAAGIDTFDCVQPTRIARHGGALAKEAGPRGRLNLRNARFRDDPAPIEADCPCYCCRTFSRAYMHHLIKAGEHLAGQLLTLHNMTFMNRMMADIRAAIADGSFAARYAAQSPRIEFSG